MESGGGGGGGRCVKGESCMAAGVGECLLVVESELDHQSYKALLGSLRSMQNQALPFIDNC